MKIGKQKVLTFMASFGITFLIHVIFLDFLIQYGGLSMAIGWIIANILIYLLINGVWNTIKKNKQ